MIYVPGVGNILLVQNEFSSPLRREPTLHSCYACVHLKRIEETRAKPVRNMVVCLIQRFL
jgi:hypothetical protein